MSGWVTERVKTIPYTCPPVVGSVRLSCRTEEGAEVVDDPDDRGLVVDVQAGDVRPGRRRGRPRIQA